MDCTLAERQKIFLAYRPIFSGTDARIRQPKAIRERVMKHSQNEMYKRLLIEFGVDRIVTILKGMLVKKVFQSTSVSVAEFPDLFRASPSREQQRVRSEENAAHKQDRALIETAIAEKDEEKTIERETVIAAETVEPETRKQEPEINANSSRSASPPTTSQEFEEESSFCLYPVYFPFRVQHMLLTKTQSFLEESCFKFAKKWLPSALKAKGWECAEATELTRWIQFLISLQSSLPKEALSLGEEKSLQDLLLPLSNLRHSAVHRHNISAHGIHRLIDCAFEAVRALKDDPRAGRLEELSKAIEARIQDMELHKNFLEGRLDKELQVIKRKREELERREEEIIASALREDHDKKVLAGDIICETAVGVFLHPLSLPEVPLSAADKQVKKTSGAWLNLRVLRLWT